MIWNLVNWECVINKLSISTEFGKSDQFYKKELIFGGRGIKKAWNYLLFRSNSKSFGVSHENLLRHKLKFILYFYNLSKIALIGNTR